MDFEITPRNLYIIGIGSFSIIVVCNFIILMINWDILTIFNKISSLASMIFNIALVGLFNYLLSLEPKMEETQEYSNIDEILEELDKKTNGKPKRRK